MTDAATLARLRTFISTSDAPDRDPLQGALEDLLSTVAAQALVIRSLAAHARNSTIGRSNLEAVLSRPVLDALSESLGRPVGAGITVGDAEKAAAELADHLARGSDAAAILTAIARIVAVFV